MARQHAGGAAPFRLICLVMVFAAGLSAGGAAASGLARTIASIKPSVVGIGSFQKTRSPAVVLSGTGFVVGDGLSVITNAHVVKPMISGENSEGADTLGVIVAKGDAGEFRRAVLVAYDAEHDLAHLRVGGAPMPALELGDSGKVAEGQLVAFTGFPLGAVLGLHHVTHRATVSAITPVAMPALDAGKLDAKVIAQLRRTPYVIFQLDGTAYPGNSGSPVYDPETGIVYGVVNMVFVKGLKEAAIANPSGIAYAIPGQHVRELLQKK